jgi:hypothetical protein
MSFRWLVVVCSSFLFVTLPAITIYYGWYNRKALHLFLIVTFILFPFFLLAGEWPFRGLLQGELLDWFARLYSPILFLTLPAIAFWYGRRISRPLAFLAAFCPFALSGLMMIVSKEVNYLYSTLYGGLPDKLEFLSIPEWVNPEGWFFSLTGLGVALGLIGLGSAPFQRHRWLGIAIVIWAAIMWCGFIWWSCREQLIYASLFGITIPSW